MSNVIEVEVNGARNGNLFFGPLARRVRGRFELSRAIERDKEAGNLTRSWAEPIPGQRIGIDLDSGDGYIIEPLHDEAHDAIRQRIQKTHRLEPARQSFNGVHAPTWLYWLKRAVDANHAKLMGGKFPDGIGPKKQEFVSDEPNVNLFMPRRATPMDKLTEAIDRQTEMFGKLLSALMEDRKRK